MQTSFRKAPVRSFQGPKWPVDSNPGPSCLRVTVLTTSRWHKNGVIYDFKGPVLSDDFLPKTCPPLKTTDGMFCGLSTAAVQPFPSKEHSSSPNISYDLPFRNIIYIIDCWHNYYDYFYVLLGGKSGTDTAQPNKTPQRRPSNVTHGKLQVNYGAEIMSMLCHEKPHTQ